MKIENTKRKKMVKHESLFHTKVMKWLKYNLEYFPPSFLIETKVVRPGRNTFSFSELSEKEERLLLQAKNGTVLQTHSDAERRGTNCDASCISGGGFIFLQWVRQGNKQFYVICIDDMIKARKVFGKTLTEETAMIISHLIGELK